MTKSLRKVYGKKFPYIPCELKNYSSGKDPFGNPQKSWFILYYAWSIEEKKLVRKRYSKNLNLLSNPEERLRFCQAKMDEIDLMLKEGATAEKKENNVDNSTSRFEKKTVIEAFADIIKIKEDTLKLNSYKPFRSVKNVFIPWLESTNKELLLRKLETPTIIDFLLFLLTEKKLTKNSDKIGVTNRTRNNYLNTIINIINEIMARDRRIFKENPAESIPLLNVSKKGNAAYSPQQMRKIKNAALNSGMEQYLLFISFIYYLCARPDEIYEMKVGQIEVPQQRVFIPSSDAKNNEGDHVDIFPPLMEIIKKSGILQYSSTDFIFSSKGTPGEKRCNSKYFWSRNVKILKEIGLYHSKKEYTLYSFKHSGACNLYLSGVDVLDIQRHLRHKSLQQTMDYLRDLDLFRKKDHFSKVQAF